MIRTNSHFDTLLQRRVLIGWGSFGLLISLAVSGITAEQDPSGARGITVASEKVARYVTVVINRYDNNKNGQLEQAEWQQMSGQPQQMDRDGDSTITFEKFQAYVLDYGRARMPARLASPSESDLGATEMTSSGTTADTSNEQAESAINSPDDAKAKPAAAPRTTKFVVRPSRGLGNLPGWFLGQDGDGDGQLTLREFSASSAGRLREFQRLDQNGDGVVTPREATSQRSEETTTP